MSPEQIKIGRALRSSGYSWREIGAHLRVSYNTARRYVLYGAPARPLERTLQALHKHDHPRADEIARRLAEIPDDTRTLTAQICGDPLPGRSALDREAQPCQP